MIEQKDLSQEDEALSLRISQSMEKANELSENNRYEQSIALALQAWEALPESKESWDLFGWIADSLFYDYYEVGDFESAKLWATRGLEGKASEVSTSEFINMGMACFELGQETEAYGYFHQAYESGKRRAFQERPIKYLDFYLSALKDQRYG